MVSFERACPDLTRDKYTQILLLHELLIGCKTIRKIPSLEIAKKMAKALDISLDQMVYGQQNEKARTHIVDNELLNLFNKTQDLSDDQKKTVMDLLSAFLLKASLRQELTH